MPKQSVVCSICGTPRTIIRHRKSLRTASFWCSVCNKDVLSPHQTPPPPAEWEAEFDEKFCYRDVRGERSLSTARGIPGRIKKFIRAILATQRHTLAEQIKAMKKTGDGRTHARKEAYKRTYNNCPDCGVDITNRHIFALRCCDCAIKRNSKQSQGFGSYNEALDVVLALLDTHTEEYEK